jgi:hypothetical protein
MKIKAIYDNGGETVDRYTVVYDVTDGTVYESLDMSTNPFDPQGFCQHGTAVPGKHLGKKIKFKDLPKDCQSVVEDDLYEEVFNG